MWLSTVRWGQQRSADIVRLLLLSSVFALSACSVSQLNTESFVDLPVTASRLLVVYQPSDPGASTPVADADELFRRQAQRERMVAALGEALEARLPSQLAATGLKASFVRASSISAVLNSKSARDAVSHVLYLKPQQDEEECRSGGGSCSHRFTLRATLLRPGAAPTLWRTDLQEAYFTSSAPERSRFDPLVDQLAKALSTAVSAQ